MTRITPPALRPALSDLTLSAIQAEATRAHLRHGDHSMLSPHYDSGDRLAILVEEVGEVAHELTYDQQPGQGIGEGRRDELVKELIQVAAMAASWVEYLEGSEQLIRRQEAEGITGMHWDNLGSGGGAQ